MQLNDVIVAWNAQADKYKQWSELDADERVSFALKHAQSKARDALDELCVAVYTPDKSGISVAHAIGHVRQVFSA